MRDPGERFLELVKEKVVFVDSEMWNTPEPKDHITLRLTPNDQLEREFPPRDPGTFYGFFSSTTDTDVVVHTLHLGTLGEEEKAIIEAALGLMDNPLFR